MILRYVKKYITELYRMIYHFTLCNMWKSGFPYFIQCINTL